jgi:regulator of protease activity HflC (stomatin/prohibitin superfamily)
MVGITILIAVLAILSIAGFIVSTKLPREAKSDYSEVQNPKRLATIISASLALVAGIVTFFSSLTIISATEVGVPVSFGYVSDHLNSGVHFVAPWTTVDKYPTRPVTVQLAGNEKVIARTADAGQMSVEIAARWRVEAKDAKTLYFQSRTGDVNAISDTIVLPNLRQAVGQVYSVTGNLDAISDRERVAEDIRVQLNKQLAHYGIIVDTVSMRSVEPDNATAATISQFASQQQATRIAEEAKKTATIEAERRLIEAQGLKKAAQAAGGMSSSELQSVCMQVWQQVITKGIEKGVSVYTNPCSNASTTVIGK